MDSIGSVGSFSVTRVTSPNSHECASTCIVVLSLMSHHFYTDVPCGGKLVFACVLCVQFSARVQYIHVHVHVFRRTMGHVVYCLQKTVYMYMSSTLMSGLRCI